jgi:glyoxylase-like metal-dependent hydrolase (beta-lactamase superfamily II)
MSASDRRGSGSVITIDCDYVYPQAAAAYLMIEGDRAAFIENNTAHAVPRLLATLAEYGLRPEQVKYAIITHVHLDHAGGTSALLQACPNATVLAHPKAARHVIHPERLVESSRAVYGAELFEKLYGEIRGVPEERVRTMADEEELRFGERTLRFFHTRGHADHHFCVFDSESQGVFTGDSFGIGYVQLQKNGPFLYPSTTPTQFHPAEARKSVERIRDCGATHAYLTHFGPFEQLGAGADQLLHGLDVFEEQLHRARDSELKGDELQQYCEAGVREFFEQKLASHGLTLSADEWNLLGLDIGINAMGIAFVAERARRKSTESGSSGSSA